MVLSDLLEKRRSELHEIFDSLDSSHSGKAPMSVFEALLRKVGIPYKKKYIVVRKKKFFFDKIFFVFSVDWIHGEKTFLWN